MTPLWLALVVAAVGSYLLKLAGVSLPSKADDPYANVGRNAPCPCGSGKKFKMCHGRPGAV